MNLKLVLTKPRLVFNRETLVQWLPRLQKGGAAIVDRALFAGTNFVINILLARWMPTEAYGAFAVAYSIFLLMGSFHSALITGPMLVFGPGKYFDRFRRYLSFLLAGHMAYSVVIALAAVVAASIVGRSEESLVGQALMGLAIAAPMVLLLWVVRRAFYVDSRPQWAATGGAIYLVLMVGGIIWLREVGQLTAFSGLVMMGLSSLVVSFWLVLILRPQLTQQPGDPLLRGVLNDHWNYGKWSVASWGLQWFPQNIYYTVLPALVGLEGPAALRSVMNLVMPILHANGAIAMLLGPTFVRALKQKGSASLHRRVKFGAGLFVVTSAAYGLVVVVLGPWLIDKFYNGQYNAYATLPTLLLIGLIPLSAGVMAVFTGALNAMERFSRVFGAYVFASLVTLTLGLGLLATGGITGAVGGLLASSVATAAASAWYYRRALRQEQAAEVEARALDDVEERSA